VFREAGKAHIQSRDAKPFDRYFPELLEALCQGLPDGCVLDGEIVIAAPGGLDFDALQQRIHPAASRIERLAHETPASFVAFDLIAVDGADISSLPQDERRLLLQA
jgi:ATP-dependent DNA ligase